MIHLHTNSAPLSTPLATYYRVQGGRTTRHSVTPSDITIVLRISVSALGPSIGFLLEDITARSLCAGGAMALLVARVSTDII